jgi:hypothetical protein
VFHNYLLSYSCSDLSISVVIYISRSGITLNDVSHFFAGNDVSHFIKDLVCIERSKFDIFP